MVVLNGVVDLEEGDVVDVADLLDSMDPSVLVCPILITLTTGVNFWKKSPPATTKLAPAPRRLLRLSKMLKSSSM